jgi:hypothetical protein
MSTDVQKHFKGYSKPNYTPVPDELFDEQLPDLSGAELKVLLYIIRRTFGFKKESDNISLNQLLHGITTKEDVVLDRGTGLSKKTLLETLKNLVEKNLIISERRRSKEKGDEPTTYRLNIVGSREKNTTPRGVKSTPGGGVKSTPGPSDKNYTTQDTVIQKTVNNTVNGVVKGGEKSALQHIPDLGDPPEKTAYIARDVILKALGDEKSVKFYELVAAKIPEQVIREVLSGVRSDGARSPAKLFTYKIQRYALAKQKV